MMFQQYMNQIHLKKLKKLKNIHENFDHFMVFFLFFSFIFLLIVMIVVLSNRENVKFYKSSNVVEIIKCNQNNEKCHIRLMISQSKFVIMK